MKDHTVNMHEVGKEISPEQFIAEHTFVYIVKGIMNLYDGSEHKVLESGECCIARKNRLARFNKVKVDGELEKVFVFFDEAFLRRFQDSTTHPINGWCKDGCRKPIFSLTKKTKSRQKSTLI